MRNWSLPFAERYHGLRNTISNLPNMIETKRQTIEIQREILAKLEQELSEAEVAWGRMQREDADQIAALEAHHEAVMSALRAQGWNV